MFLFTGDGDIIDATTITYTEDICISIHERMSMHKT